jgi:hypothetical protein
LLERPNAPTAGRGRARGVDRIHHSLNKRSW